MIEIHFENKFSDYILCKKVLFKNLIICYPIKLQMHPVRNKHIVDNSCKQQPSEMAIP